MDKSITLTIAELEWFLAEQKRITTDYLLGLTYWYNTESTAGESKTIQNIDKEKFKEAGSKSSYPADFETLKRYIK